MCCAGDVPGRDRGDPGRDRAHTVPEDHGAPVPADRPLCLQPTLPGEPTVRPSVSVCVCVCVGGGGFSYTW